MEGRFSIAPADFFKIGTQAITALVGHVDDTIRPAIVAQLAAQENQAQTQLSMLIRITSYNVCYTKLLRCTDKSTVAPTSGNTRFGWS